MATIDRSAEEIAEIRDAKLHNLRERLKDCAALARELDLDDTPILRAKAALPQEEGPGEDDTDPLDGSLIGA